MFIYYVRNILYIWDHMGVSENMVYHQMAMLMGFDQRSWLAPFSFQSCGLGPGKMISIEFWEKSLLYGDLCGLNPASWTEPRF